MEKVKAQNWTSRSWHSPTFCLEYESSFKNTKYNNSLNATGEHHSLVCLCLIKRLPYSPYLQFTMQAFCYMTSSGLFFQTETSVAQVWALWHRTRPSWTSYYGWINWFVTKKYKKKTNNDRFDIAVSCDLSGHLHWHQYLYLDIYLCHGS